MGDTAEQRLAALGLELPEPMQTANLPFELIRIDGNHAYLAGHVPLAADGGIAKPLGKVGAAHSRFSTARSCAFALVPASGSARLSPPLMAQTPWGFWPTSPAPIDMKIQINGTIITFEPFKIRAVLKDKKIS